MVFIIFLFIVGCGGENKVLNEKQDIDLNLSVVKEVAETTKLAVRVYKYSFDPNIINISYGDDVELHVTSMDVGHGFALVDFGINNEIPAKETVLVKFKADKKGEFDFFSSVYSGKGYKNMTGKIIVG